MLFAPKARDLIFVARYLLQKPRVSFNDARQKISLAEGEPARLEEGICGSALAASAYKGSKQASVAGGGLLAC